MVWRREAELVRLPASLRAGLGITDPVSSLCEALRFRSRLAVF